MWWEGLRAIDGTFDPEKLSVTPSLQAEISALAQGSDEWLRARYGRLTASNFGAAAGHHVPGARKKLLETMLWPEMSKLTGMAARFAAYGTKNEPVARDVYVADRRSRGHACLRVFETGLLVSLDHGWLGSSPDFIVEEYTEIHERPNESERVIVNPHHSRQPYIIQHPQGARSFIANTPPCSKDYGRPPGATPVTQACGEIKCPATFLLYSRSEKHALHAFPEYYYDQIQGVMAINHWPWCDTVVYTPHETEVIRFYANVTYWETELFPKLQAFYFNDFLPRLALRMQGKLKRGEIDARLVIPVCVFDLGIDMVLENKNMKKRKHAPDGVTVEDVAPL